jgi:DNA-binding MarR family transcriptional regulator
MEKQRAEQYVVHFDKWMSLLLQQGARLARNSAIPPSQLFLVRMLNIKGPSRVSDLASFLGVTSPAITGLVNELVKSGYVTRQESAKDRRVTLIDLNEKGRLALAEVEKDRKERMVEMLRHLDEEEIDSFINTMSKLVDIVKQI